MTLGSEWNKWDLHLHTPHTKLSNQFTGQGDLMKAFSEKIESSDVIAFGITDYFCCENYFKLTEAHREQYPHSKKLLLLNIEFRLNVAVNKQGEEVNIHVLFSNEVPKQRIDAFLQTLKTHHTNHSGVKISCKSLESDQFQSATVVVQDIVDSLKETFGNEECYLIIAAANNAGLRPASNSPRKLTITDEIDKICHGFFGGRQNISYYLNVNRYENSPKAIPKPVIGGCDAHSFEELEEYLGKHVKRLNTKNNQEEIHKDITWIKAEPTFEGLRQILFEPAHRVKISEEAPREPLRRIDDIQLTFPATTKIKRSTSAESNPFCLSELHNNIKLSPYLTCIIGGRGSGKSTLISVISERLGVKTDYFKQNSLIIDEKPYNLESDLSSYVVINGTNEVEFVSQGMVEKLAVGDELTKLIFEERIHQTDPQFNTLDAKINELVNLSNEIITDLNESNNIKENIKEKQKELDTASRIVDSLNDPAYKQITESINTLSNETESIKVSENRYESLLESIRHILVQNPIIISKNEIDDRVLAIIEELRAIQEVQIDGEQISIKPIEFLSIDLQKKELEDRLEAQRKSLRDYFEAKGTSEEIINDAQNAAESVTRLSAEIKKLESDNSVIVRNIEENEQKLDELSELYTTYHGLIDEKLDIINARLSVSNENVEYIAFHATFNTEKFLNSLFDDFYDTFTSYKIAGTSGNNVKEILFLIDPQKSVLNMIYADFLSLLNTRIDENSYRRTNNYVKIVLDIFSSEVNFNIYMLKVKKHLYNLRENLSIDGYYGEQELQNCSFGQRCTAVIITLLMTGVKPLIIDEPEAHLDNRLIADYLVGLIKDKKLDRQIIFSTHNSNFVINGDSELVLVLEMSAYDTFTRISSTTIEDLRNRDKLLKLEGGKDAFLIRERKYGLKER